MLVCWGFPRVLGGLALRLLGSGSSLWGLACLQVVGLLRPRWALPGVACHRCPQQVSCRQASLDLGALGAGGSFLFFNIFWWSRHFHWCIYSVHFDFFFNVFGWIPMFVTIFYLLPEASFSAFSTLTWIFSDSFYFLLAYQLHLFPF